MDVAFADWLTHCPDKLKFALEYVDLRADIANVIETYEYEFASIEVEKEVTEAVLNKLINQDWSEQNEYISDLIDQEIE